MERKGFFIFIFSDKLNLMCLLDIQAEAESVAQKTGGVEDTGLRVTG